MESNEKEEFRKALAAGLKKIAKDNDCEGYTFELGYALGLIADLVCGGEFSRECSERMAWDMHDQGRKILAKENQKNGVQP